MQKKLENAETKNNLLRNMIGHTHNMASVLKKWETFELAIGDFDNLLAEQTK